MIQIPRSFFRQLRSVLRKAFGRVSASIVFNSGPDGFSVRCQQDGIAVCYSSPEGRGVDQLVLPAQAIADLEGKDDADVALETKGAKVRARWQDAGVPRTFEFDTLGADKLAEFPQSPGRFTPQGDGFVKCLDDAMQSASRDAVRFALNKIQIRGSSSSIIATDGHALLWQNGFEFPFSEDFLIPRTNFFGCKEVQGSVEIAKSKTHFCVRSGPWTIFLLIDKEGRFPRVESIIPANLATATRVHLSPDNAAFLANALSRLPGDEEEVAPVTLDLNGEVTIRARADGQEQSTAVVLSGASVTGKAIRYATNRNLLARALSLGFTEGCITSVESPAVFQDEHRRFIFQGLGKDRIVGPNTNDVRLHSNATSINRQPPINRRNDAMKPSRLPPPPAIPHPVEANGDGDNHTNNLNGNGQTHAKTGFNALVEESQSIQNGLRDLLLRTNHLLIGLKAYRRHAKTMQSTLASLRQLQQVEA